MKFNKIFSLAFAFILFFNLLYVSKNVNAQQNLYNIAYGKSVISSCDSNPLNNAMLTDGSDYYKPYTKQITPDLNNERWAYIDLGATSLVSEIEVMEFEKNLVSKCKFYYSNNLIDFTYMGEITGEEINSSKNGSYSFDFSLQNPIKARFVKVLFVSSDSPKISEIFVYGENPSLSEVNLAYKKEAVVSGLFKNSSANSLTDGHSTMADLHKTVITPDQNGQIWAYIDLGENVSYNKINIKEDTGENSSNSSFITGYKLYASNDLSQNSWQEIYANTKGILKLGKLTDSVLLSNNQTARYLKMQITGVLPSEILQASIVEIEVFGRATQNAKIFSSIYIIDDTTISNINANTDIKTFLENITTYFGTQIKIVDENQNEIKSGKILESYKAIVFGDGFFSKTYSFDIGTMPFAQNVKITGSANIGDTIYGNYDYIDYDGDQNNSSFAWYESTDGISFSQIFGEINDFYKIKESDYEKTIKFEVTPKNNALKYKEGSPKFSENCVVVGNLAFLKPAFESGEGVLNITDGNQSTFFTNEGKANKNISLQINLGKICDLNKINIKAENLYRIKKLTISSQSKSYDFTNEALASHNSFNLGEVLKTDILKIDIETDIAIKIFEIEALFENVNAKKDKTDILNAINNISFGENGDSFTTSKDFELILSGENEVLFSYKSTDERYLKIEANRAIITRPCDENKTVSLILTATKNGSYYLKTFYVTILKSQDADMSETVYNVAYACDVAVSGGENSTDKLLSLVNEEQLYEGMVNITPNLDNENYILLDLKSDAIINFLEICDYKGSASFCYFVTSVDNYNWSDLYYANKTKLSEKYFIHSKKISPTLARYIKIFIISNENPSITEIKAFGQKLGGVLNIAYNKPVILSNIFPDYSKSVRITDGKTINIYDHMCGISQDKNENYFAIIDLGINASYDKAVIKTASVSGFSDIKSYYLEVSDDLINFRKIYSSNNEILKNSNKEIVFKTQNARYLRLLCDNAEGNNKMIFLREIEVFGSTKYDAYINSAKYLVDNKELVISGVEQNESIIDFKKNIYSYFLGTSFKLLKQDGITEAVNNFVENGYFLKVYGDFINEKTYKIVLGKYIQGSNKTENELVLQAYEEICDYFLNGGNVILPQTASNNTKIIWKSYDKNITINEGKIITSANATQKALLLAEFINGKERLSKEFYISIKNNEASENDQKDISFSTEIKGIFNDVDRKSYYYQAVNYFYENGIINGVSENYFKPNDNIKREEFIKLICKAFNIEKNNGALSFNDVLISDWFYPYVLSAKNSKIINGINENSFGTGLFITREDMAKICFNVARRNTEFPESQAYAKFTDDNIISSYAKNDIYALKAKNIINGNTNNEFLPKNYAKRSEAVKIIYEMLKIINRLL